MTAEEMRKEASALGIKGIKKMKKVELEKAIAEAKESQVEIERPEKKTVTMKAFTGMYIGEFEVVRETKKSISVMTKRGELKFDKATGIQTNGNNPKFANRIELA